MHLLRKLSEGGSAGAGCIFISVDDELSVSSRSLGGMLFSLSHTLMVQKRPFKEGFFKSQRSFDICLRLQH